AAGASDTRRPRGNTPAPCTRKASGRSPTTAAIFSIPASVATSAATGTTFGRAASAPSRLARRATASTSTPSAASTSVISRPIPADAPVTTARRCMRGGYHGATPRGSRVSGDRRGRAEHDRELPPHAPAPLAAQADRLGARERDGHGVAAVHGDRLIDRVGRVAGLARDVHLRGQHVGAARV